MDGMVTPIVRAFLIKSVSMYSFRESKQKKMEGRGKNGWMDEYVR